MKTKLIVIMAALALVQPALAESECETFEREQHATEAETQPQDTRDHFVFRQNDKRDWSWSRVASDGRVIATSSETFHVFGDCRRDAERNGWLRFGQSGVWQRAVTIPYLHIQKVVIREENRGCKNKLSWRVWRAQFEAVCQKHGMSSSTAKRHSGSKSSHTFNSTERDIREAWCNGHTPLTAFEDLGFDAVTFEIVWMPKFCRNAPTYTYLVDCKDAAFREKMWFEHFLRGHSPKQALLAIQKQSR